MITIDKYSYMPGGGSGNDENEPPKKKD